MTKKKITIDRNADTISTDYSWQMGFGNDHAYQLHRTDVCEHIKLAHDELGIQYIRCHGVFDDDMLTYQRMSDYRMFRTIPHAKKIEEINFRQVGHIYDNLLSCGVKPFVELSFMPSALASGKKLGLRYNPNITMPKSLKAWSEYISQFLFFLLERYGKEEVESWYFEVWNEPDLSCFFSGSKQDYFRLYECTAKTIKKVDSALRVGGPSTSACLWLDEFVDFCEKNHVPCDFVSTHHYPGDAFGNFVNLRNVRHMMSASADAARNHKSLSEAMTNMFFLPEDFVRWDKGTLANLDDEAKAKIGNRPLFITEWNSMAVFGSPVHDEKYSAAFAVKSCMDLNGSADAYMFWCCSDIFEEQFMLPKPFVGSYGVVSNDGIPKPNFWGFKILSQLYPRRLKLPMRTNEDVEYAAYIEDNKTQILLCTQNQDYYKNEEYSMEIHINCRVNQVMGQFIDDSHCNPKAEWTKLGKPDYLTREQISEIKRKTRMVSEPVSFIRDGEETVVTVKMHTNEVVLLSME